MRTTYSTELLATPNRGVRSGRGCLFFSGRGATPAGCLASIYGEPVLRGVVDVGIRSLVTTWGGTTTWGNGTAVAAAETARAAQVASQGVTGDKVVCVGISMGSITALRYAMAYPTRVAALALIVPIPDVQGMYDANTGSFQSEIGTAYGARPSNAQNPASNTSAFASIPTRIWYSTSDATALPAPIVSFAAATGATLTSLGAVGHAFDSISTADVASFLKGYA